MNIRKLASSSLAIAFAFSLLVAPFSFIKEAQAAKFVDGTWVQTGTGAVIDFIPTTEIPNGGKIVLTFPSQATVDAVGVSKTVTGQTAPTRANIATDNSIIITLDTAITASTPTTVTLSDALTAYTSTTFAQQSIAINTISDTGAALDYGVGIITNNGTVGDYTTHVTASVPLFVNMAIDDTTIDLGTLSTASVKDGSQIYTFNSNNDKGVTAKVSAGGALTNGTHNFADAGTQSTIAAGTEKYGVEVTSATMTIGAAFVAGATTNVNNPVPTSATTLVSTAVPTDAQTATVKYSAAISGLTNAGIYTQTVTTTVATNN